MKKRYLFLFMLVMSVSFVRYEALAATSITDTDGNTQVQTEKFANEDKIRFDTGGTERMIIDNIGSVGIGTPTPGENLHIKTSETGPTSIILDNTNAGYTEKIQFEVGGLYPAYIQKYNPAHATTPNLFEIVSPWYMKLVTGDAGQPILLMPSGNVGIGTTNPKAKLHNDGDFITKGPYTDVRAYGAVGDGTTDDTTAVTNAISGTPTGGTVLFPKGRYKITSSLTINKSLSLVGEGYGSIIKYTGTDYGIKWMGVQSPGMANIVYIGNSLATGGIYFFRGLGGLFQHVVIFGTGGVAVDLQGAMKMVFIDCQVSSNPVGELSPALGDWGGNPAIHWQNRLDGVPPNHMEPNLNTWINCGAVPWTDPANPNDNVGIGWEFSSGARCFLVNNQTQGLATGIKFDYTGASPPAYIDVVNQWMEDNTTDYNDPWQWPGTYGIGMQLGRITLSDKGGTLYREGNSTTANPHLVFHENNPTQGAGLGMLIQSNYSTAISGQVLENSGAGVAVKGQIVGSGKAIYGICNGASGYAGYFDGNVEATGTVTAAAVSTSGTISAGSSVTIGSGTPIAKHLSGTATWDPASIGNNAVGATTVTVSGAALGDTVVVTFSQIGARNMLISGHVQAADTVRVVLENKTGLSVDLPSGTVRADVWKH